METNYQASNYHHWSGVWPDQGKGNTVHKGLMFFFVNTLKMLIMIKIFVTENGSACKLQNITKLQKLSKSAGYLKKKRSPYNKLKPCLYSMHIHWAMQLHVLKYSIVHFGLAVYCHGFSRFSCIKLGMVWIWRLYSEAHLNFWNGSNFHHNTLI